jgi:ubiquitin-activating enzyme E1
LHQHPLDSVDEDGEPFWTGTRRAPSALPYSDGEKMSEEEKKINENIIDFVRYAARLRIETFISKDKNQIKSTEVSIDDVIIALMKNAILVDEVDEGQSVAQYICTKLEKPKQIAPNFKDELNIATFEKDDDSNGHVAFVTAASNLHAISYGIMPVDAIETRRVAGCIVPAMITTTALVSALSCIELIKLLQNAPLHSYQNAFVNLALPFFAFTAPLPAEVVPGLHDSIHTIWDRIIIKESKKSKEKGGITL